MNDLTSFFDTGGADVTELDDAVALILNNATALTKDQISDLLTILREHGTQQVTLDASFDIRQEIEQQIMLVRAMRQNVLTEGGRIKTDIPAREVKEVVSSSNTMIASLMKYMEQIVSMGRLMQVEKAVISTLEDIDPAIKEQFLKKLAENLEAVE